MGAPAGSGRSRSGSPDPRASSEQGLVPSSPDASREPSQAASAAAPAVSAHRRRLLLLACACILGNEFCERLAYYAIQTNLGLYLKKELGYTAAVASQSLQAWKSFTYLTPLLGAYLADAKWGKYLVIVVFSCCYWVGMSGVSLVNLIPAIKPVNGGPPPGAPTLLVFWIAMALMGLGSGGIKPCVSAFGGEQFNPTSARERSWRASFFNYFYFSVNVGSLISTVVLVPVQETKGYGIGYSIPTVAFAIAIAALLLGTKLYNRMPPQGSPFSRLYRVLRTAVRNRKLPLPSDPSELYEESEAVVAEREKRRAEAEAEAAAAAALAAEVEKIPLASARSGSFSKFRLGAAKKRRPHSIRPAIAPIERIPHTEGMPFLDKAAIKPAAEGELPVVVADAPRRRCCFPQSSAKSAREPVTVSMVEESKAFYRLIPIFLLVAVWQMTYDPIFTLFPYPGDMMERRLGNMKVPASTISFANTFGVLITIPIYDQLIVPLFKKLKRPITVTQRIGAGFVLQLVALLSAGFIETARYRAIAPVRAKYEADGGSVLSTKPNPSDDAYVQPMSVWVQFAPYYILGAAEVFTNVGVIELMFVGVSSGMRSLGAAIYLFTVAIGTFLATALNLIVAAATKADPWINDNSLYGHYDYYYYLNAGILFVAFCIYVPVSRAYIERPIAGARTDEDEEEAEDVAAAAKALAAKAQNKKRFEDKVRAHLDPEDNAVISLDKK